MHPSPLHNAHDERGAVFLPFGQEAQIVFGFDAIELEYAAVRKAAGLMDRPERGLLELRGADRLDFLHRMVSADCNGLQPGQSRRAFLLGATGRILADLLILHDESCTRIELDAPSVTTVAEELDTLLFTEDVRIADVSGRMHCLTLLGAKAGTLIGQTELEPLHHVAAEAGGRSMWIHRYDECGVRGLHLWMDEEAVQPTWDALLSDGEAEGLRPIGWAAFNTLRIEAGQPRFHIDFGPTNQPHETALLDETVSFTKGCYRGQEIVARIEAQGHPARVIVGFRAEGEALPEAGAPIYESDEAEAAEVGVVTSSTPSPMLGNVNIGLAMVKWDCREPGRVLSSHAEGRRCRITVAERPFL